MWVGMKILRSDLAHNCYSSSSESKYICVINYHKALLPNLTSRYQHNSMGYKNQKWLKPAFLWYFQRIDILNFHELISIVSLLVRNICTRFGLFFVLYWILLNNKHVKMHFLLFFSNILNKLVCNGFVLDTISRQKKIFFNTWRENITLKGRF